MKTDIENLKKRILYRSQYRGTKEMDKLLSSFITKYIDEIDTSKLKNLENFLNIDDEDLYKFYNGDEKNFNFDDKYILDLFKNFKFFTD